jgi:allophanate hydrolase subunit 2
LVGNADTAPLLEATHSGPILRAQRDITIAVCGADAAVVVEQASGRLVEIAALTPVSLQPGETLRLHGYRAGARVYIACSGGFDAMSHPLRAGDSLATLGAPRVTPRCSTPALARFHHDCTSTRILRVTLHPHAQMLPALAPRLHDSLWRVTPRADRAGIRLEGPPLIHTITTMPSHATLPGDIELTPDGAAIVLGPDAPVTGGYPVLASIIDADQSAMMQCRAGEWVRFAVVTHAEARAAWRDQQSTLNSLTGVDA